MQLGRAEIRRCSQGGGRGARVGGLPGTRLEVESSALMLPHSEAVMERPVSQVCRGLAPKAGFAPHSLETLRTLLSNTIATHCCLNPNQLN